jgi:adenylate cyclase 1
LGVRSALGAANRRKLSFRNVSNVVVQLLHTIKYSVPVPFSHIATGGSYSNSNSVAGAAPGLYLDKNARKVSTPPTFLMFALWTTSNVNVSVVGL